MMHSSKCSDKQLLISAESGDTSGQTKTQTKFNSFLIKGFNKRENTKHFINSLSDQNNESSTHKDKNKKKLLKFYKATKASRSETNSLIVFNKMNAKERKEFSPMLEEKSTRDVSC